MPEFLKGYKIVPDMFEFMQSASNWLGDRLVFLLEDNKWMLQRLAALQREREICLVVEMSMLKTCTSLSWCVTHQ